MIDKLKLCLAVEVRQDIMYLKQRTRNYLNQNNIKADININKNTIWITLCPYKFLYSTEDNLNGLSYTEFIEMCNKLQAVLSDLEVLFEFKILSNIKDSKLCAIDLTQNISVDYPFQNYIPMWENIKPRYSLDMSKVSSTTDYCEVKVYSTVYFKSKSRENHQNSFTVLIYDKKKQLKDTGIPLAPEYENLNIIRIELAFNNATSVKRKLNISTLGEIIDDYDFINLNNTRLKILENYLFYEPNCLNEDSKIDNISEYIKLAEKIKSENKRNSVILIALSMCADKLDCKLLEEVLLNLDFSTAHINKNMKIIRKFKQSKRLKVKGSTLTIGQLYNEVYDKLFRNGNGEIRK